MTGKLIGSRKILRPSYILYVAIQLEQGISCIFHSACFIRCRVDFSNDTYEEGLRAQTNS
jgi:hypothetical protein